MTYGKWRGAIRAFGLGERATLDEIKARYRVIETNGVIPEYVESYRYCFPEQEYREQDPEERLKRRFMGDPPWNAG